MRNFRSDNYPALLRRAVLGASLTIVPASPILVPQSAYALPRSCIIRTYYQTAQLQTEVGVRSSCPGVKRWGRMSSHVELETVQLVPEGPSGGGGSGGLPCEFQNGQDAECNNLPIPRP